MLLSRRFRYFRICHFLRHVILHARCSALLTSQVRTPSSLAWLRDIVYTMHNDHELLYKSWREALVYVRKLRFRKKGLDMTTFSTCMALFIRNVSSYKQDSLWSWFICLCCTICVILTIGLTYSLGVLKIIKIDWHASPFSKLRNGKFANQVGFKDGFQVTWNFLELFQLSDFNEMRVKNDQWEWMI